MGIIIQKNSWFIKDEDGNTLAYKLPNHESNIIYKRESLLELARTINNLIEEQQQKLQQLLDINNILQKYKNEE